MCAGDCQFFPSALPSYLVQSHKKTGYIYGRHILSSYIFYIFLHLTFYLIQSHKKQSIFIYLYITYFIKIFFTFSITYQYSHFHPFLVQRHKKTTYIDVTYFLTMFFTFFLSYINLPSLLVQLYKRQPIYGGRIFSSSFTYSYITCIKILTFPSIWFRVKEDGPVSLVYKRTASTLYIPFQNKIS